MEAMTIEKLKMLDAKHGTKSAPKKRRLKVNGQTGYRSI